MQKIYTTYGRGGRKKFQLCCGVYTYQCSVVWSSVCHLCKGFPVMFTLSTTSNNENGEVTYVGMRLRRAYIFSLLTFIMECKGFGGRCIHRNIPGWWLWHVILWSACLWTIVIMISFLHLCQQLELNDNGRQGPCCKGDRST